MAPHGERACHRAARTAVHRTRPTERPDGAEGRLPECTMKLCPACREEYDDGVRYCPRDGAGLVRVTAARAATVAMYDALIGEILDERYRVDGRIGEGGLAVVYSGTHLAIDKPVAIKVLREEFSGDDTLVQRFLREARTSSRLSHPNIVAIFDFGRTPKGAPYFVMERLRGPTLGDVLAGGKALSLPRTLAIAKGIAAGLGAAHEQGVVHRDLKPDNVILVSGADGGEVVKLLDFGLAQVTDAAMKLTKAGQVLGTPEHMAPEQAAGKPVDARADVFALGILCYRMLSGKLPFTGASAVEVLSRLMDAAPDPLPEQDVAGTPLGPVVEGIRRALARDPAERPGDMGAFVKALSEGAGQAAQAAAAPTASVRPGSEPPEAPPRRVAVRAAPGMSATQERRMAEGILTRRQTRKSRLRRRALMLGLALLAVILGVLLAHRLGWGCPAPPGQSPRGHGRNLRLPHGFRAPPDDTRVTTWESRPSRLAPGPHATPSAPPSQRE